MGGGESGDAHVPSADAKEAKATESAVKRDFVVGVLALQGAFVEHVSLFESIQVKAVEIRSADELAGVSALVLPGGESTTIAMLAQRWGLMEPLREWVRSGRPIWGTCAGMILLADTLTGKMKEGQESIGGLQATVHRNYFGSQLGSFSSDIECPLLESSYRAVFIRAPVLVQYSDQVEVLATVTSSKSSVEAHDKVAEVPAVVAARQGNILVTSFHPELTEDAAWHRLFVRLAIGE